jgi:hypothetical protein
MKQTYRKVLTGRTYLDFVEKSRRHTAAQAFQLVCEHSASMLIELRSGIRLRPIFTSETIPFPICDKENSAKLIYFCSRDRYENNDPNESPDRLQVTRALRRAHIDISTGVPHFED